MIEPFEANGSAYAKREQRNGPPLGYVGEKLRTAVVEVWALANLPRSREGASLLEAYPETRGDLLALMQTLLKAFLGLYNMLGAANDNSLSARLLDGSMEGLEKWLRLVEREGSVLGVPPVSE